MASLKERTSHSLSARLSIRVVIYATCLMLVALSVTFYFSRQIIRREAVGKAVLALDKTVQDIGNELRVAETATYNMRWNVEHHLDDPDIMKEYCRHVLRENPSIIGCAIALEPQYYPQKDSLYMAYAFRPDGKNYPDSIRFSSQFGELPYNQQAWYVEPKKLDGPYWAEPIVGNHTKVDDIITFSLPIHDREGRFVGILANDIDIDRLSTTIYSSKPFPHSYPTLLGKNGKYIIHPDTNRLFHQTVYELGATQADSSVSAVIRRMMAGETGYERVCLDGKNYFVFFKPYEDAGWRTAIVCPEDDIFGPYHRMWFYVVLVSLIGLSMLLAFCFLITRRQLQPLDDLALLVQHMADGNFNEPIAQSRWKDEIGQLQNSFRLMQQSLAAYIKENERVSAMLKDRNEILQKAYQQIMEADRVKMAFLHNVTDRIVPPIERIKEDSDNLIVNFQNLSQEEIARLVDEIDKDSAIVTDLLDQLIEVSLRDSGNEHYSKQS